MGINFVNGRIIVKVDKDGKNWHTFSDGTKIRLERDYNNLDRKHTAQVLGEVVSADYVPRGAMLLFHHNAIHPVNKIDNISQLNGEEIATGMEYYSFDESECYLWKMPGDKEWNPLKGFATALMVFKPYTGFIEGILPERIKNVLYITSGSLVGKVCHTLHATGMPIIFNNDEGIEETIIRLRHYEDEINPREELTAVNEILSGMVENGDLYVGTSPKNCNKINDK